MIKNRTWNENGITDKDLKFSFLKQGSSNSEIVTNWLKKTTLKYYLALYLLFFFFNFRNMNNNTLYCYLKETERWIEMTYIYRYIVHVCRWFSFHVYSYSKHVVLYHVWGKKKSAYHLYRRPKIFEKIWVSLCNHIFQLLIRQASISAWWDFVRSFINC